MWYFGPRKGSIHYNDITWGFWPLKSLATQLFVKNWIRITIKKTSKLHITRLISWFHWSRANNAEKFSIEWSFDDMEECYGNTYNTSCIGNLIQFILKRNFSNTFKFSHISWWVFFFFVCCLLTSWAGGLWDNWAVLLTCFVILCWGQTPPIPWICSHETEVPFSIGWPNMGIIIMSAMASQITSLTIVYSTFYSGAHQRKHQSSMSLDFVWGIHWWLLNYPHKGPVMQKMFPFDEVITMTCHFSIFPLISLGLFRLIRTTKICINSPL